MIETLDREEAAVLPESPEPQNRKLRRLEKRASKAQARAEKAKAKAARRPRKVRTPRKYKMRRALAILVALAVTAGAAVVGYQAYQSSVTMPMATVSVEPVAGLGRTIVVRDGAISLSELAAVEAVSDQNALAFDGDRFELRNPLLVATGGQLTVTGQRLNLRSDGETSVMITVDGGSLILNGSRISSWNGRTIDTDLVDGRSSIYTTNATVDFADVVFDGLGFSQDEQHGVTFGPGTTGIVDDISVTNAYTGLEFSGDVEGLAVSGVNVLRPRSTGFSISSARGLVLQTSTVTESAASGFEMTGSSANVSLIDNDSYNNAGPGFAIGGAAGNIMLDSNRTYRNEGAGVSVSNTRGVQLVGNTVWSNTGGVLFTGANADAVLTGNTVSGNRGAGVELSSAGSSVELYNNEIDHNESGLLVADGSIIASGNTVTMNGIGIELLDSSPSATITDNTLDGNYDVGLRLIDADGLVFTGNSLMENTHAAFRVPVAGASLGLEETNQAGEGRYGIEWVFEGYGSAAELADITPIPAYFFVPNGQ